MSDWRKNNPNFNISNEVISWIIIFAAMAAFWPVGIFLLIRKLRDYASRTDFFINSVQRGSAYKKTENGVNGDYSETREERREEREETREERRQARKNRIRQKAAPKNAMDVSSTLLLILAIILLAVGASSFSDGFSHLASNMSPVWDFIKGSFYCAGGAISFVARGISIGRRKRYNKYKAAFGDREVMPIAEIAIAVGVTLKKARADLQEMTSSGWFGPTAYIDVGLDSLVLSAEAAEKARNEAYKTEQEKKVETEGPKTSSEYAAVLKELQELCETITDGQISQKIVRIRDITAKIFRTVDEDPEKLPQIKRFSEYYLPTTLKLLRSYATLERQGIEGENIAAAKQDIGRILDTLANGYEQQLDQLFKADVLDISSDIDVLENMMARDGLTDAEKFMKASGGH